jgi:DNA polymerase III delta prime subunit
MSKEKQNSIEPGIILGFPFDQLLNQECPLLTWQQDSGQDDQKIRQRNSGILMPHKDSSQNESPGTGNIIICGPPGSGKSTLALQFAVASAMRKENRSISAYISLENSPAEVKAKAQPFGWDNHLHELKHLHSSDMLHSQEEMTNHFLHILTQPQDSEEAKKCRIFKDDEDVCNGQDKEVCNVHNKIYQEFLNAFKNAEESEDNTNILEKLKNRILISSLSPQIGRAHV